MNKRDGFGHEKPGEGVTNDWIAPKWVFDALGEFDLDPCESNNQPWTSAKRGYRLTIPIVVRKKEEAHICQEANCPHAWKEVCACGLRFCLAHMNHHTPECGILLPWDGSVWCNPPYGPSVHRWVKKAAEHGNTIMLIFARVETKAWWEIWTSAHGVLFPNRRISFFQPDGQPAKTGTAPSAFIAFGLEAAERLKYAKIPGAYIYEGWSCYDGTEETDEESGDADTSGESRVGEELRVLPEPVGGRQESGQIRLAGLDSGISEATEVRRLQTVEPATAPGVQP